MKQLQMELQQKHQVRVEVYQIDVSDTEKVKEVFTAIFAEIGEVDILVNNAGFGVFREAHAATMDEIKGMFNVNVVGLMACTTMVLPKMRERRFGHIINIASQAGKIATPKSSVYSATKHAVLGYTNSLRMELSDYNVFVTSVNPGPIATNFLTLLMKKARMLKTFKSLCFSLNMSLGKLLTVCLRKREKSTCRAG